MIEQMEVAGFFRAGRFWVILIIIVAAAVVVWQKWLAGPSTEAERQHRAWEAAMRADTAGGRTPEETLKMFVEALRAGDVEQASRFFLLDEQGSRDKWLARLAELKEKNLLAQMAEDIEKKAESDEESKTSDQDFKFVVMTEDGFVGARINMELNTYSGVWKIESF